MAASPRGRFEPVDRGVPFLLAQQDVPARSPLTSAPPARSLLTCPQAPGPGRPLRRPAGAAGWTGRMALCGKCVARLRENGPNVRCLLGFLGVPDAPEERSVDGSIPSLGTSLRPMGYA